MKKTIMFSVALVLILVSLVGAFFLGKQSKTVTEKIDSYSYYCEVNLGNEYHTFWVDPTYNNNPKYYVAKIFLEKYNYSLTPQNISCEKISEEYWKKHWLIVERNNISDCSQTYLDYAWLNGHKVSLVYNSQRISINNK